MTLGEVAANQETFDALSRSAKSLLDCCAQREHTAFDDGPTPEQCFSRTFSEARSTRLRHMEDTCRKLSVGMSTRAQQIDRLNTRLNVHTSQLEELQQSYNRVAEKAALATARANAFQQRATELETSTTFRVGKVLRRSRRR